MNMRKLYVSCALILGLLVLAGALTLLGAWSGGPPVVQAQGADAYSTYYVAPGGNCGAGVDPGACYGDIQSAVDAADDPTDVVKVATGVYSDVNGYGGLSQVVYLAKNLTIRGGYTTSDWNSSDPDVHTTTLDARQQGRVVYISGDVTVTLESLHLTGGDADGLGGDVWGNAGGGVYVLSATVTLSRSIIADNRVPGGDSDEGLGGGVYADRGALTLRNNRILNNRAVAGSGVFPGSGIGGGIYCVESQLTLEGNLIRLNQATGDWGIGGGMALYACPGFLLINNVVADNEADVSGCGIELDHMSGVPSTGRMLHTTIARNLVTGVEGVRVAGGSVVTMANTILVGHDTGINVSFGSTATLTATLWANNTDSDDIGAIFTGTINVRGDPAFVDPDAGDYHIAASSVAKDRGVDVGVGVDLDGVLRDAQPDLGAYEARKQGLLRVTKAASAIALNPGDTVTYTIVVTSAGGISVTNVVFTDTLPTLQRPLNVSYDRGTCAIAGSGYGGRVACDLGDLDTGQGANITITAQVTTTVPATLPHTMRNTARAVSDQGQSVAYADTILQNCHARVEGALPEYTTVQAAVDAAGAGDEVWIAGICTGAFERQNLFQQVYLTKSLTLRGGYSTDFSAWDPGADTTLDASGQGRVIYVDGLISVTVEALNLTGGDATDMAGTFIGYGDAGGGVYAFGATVTLSRTRITDNIASTRIDGYGGGVGVVGADLTLFGAVLADNVASSAPFGQGHGGGLSGEVSTVRLERSRLENNVASSVLLGVGQGGGAYFYQSDLEANATLWLSNTVSGLGWIEGGGLHVIGSAPFTLTNCVLADNEAEDGGALYVEGLYEGVSGVLLHPTIARNGGDVGVSVNATATVAITNAVVVSHNVGIGAAEGGTVAISGVLWHDNVTDTVAVNATIQVSNEVAGTPAFTSDGYHLTAASVAVNRGVGAGVPVDIDGDPRVGVPDIGADEYVWDHTVYLSLVLRNY